MGLGAMHPYMPSIPRDLVACSKYVTLLPSLSSGEWSQRMPGDCQIGLLVCMPALVEFYLIRRKERLLAIKFSGHHFIVARFRLAV